MAADEIYNLPDKPTYHTDIRKLQDSDPASASNTFNPVLQKIVENTHYAKLRADEAAAAAGAAQDSAAEALETLKAMLGGELPTETLSDNSPAVIQKVAQMGMGANFWSVGDNVPIALNGTVAALEFTGETYYAFIIGFDHNEEIEGKGIHFQFGKTGDGKDIAFVDGSYGITGSTAGFRMNTTNTNSGGWKDCVMRSTVCPAFLVALPEEWQAIISDCTKYSDNTGGGTDTASNVTATTDKIFLLAEFEVFGVRTGANSAEQNFQKQYDYYANGNSRVKYRHSAVSSTCSWWVRSVSASYATYFRNVHGGGSNSYYAYSSIGFAPGFKVA